MDFLKENDENRFVSNSRNIKSNLTGFKQMKQAVKPLSDVKNILLDNICGSQKKMQQKGGNVEVTNKVEEDDFDDLYFYREDTEDDYGDIIPRALQLNGDDIRRLACVFDRWDCAKTSAPQQGFEPLELSEKFDLGGEEDDVFDLCSVGFDTSDDIFDVKEDIFVF